MRYLAGLICLYVALFALDKGELGYDYLRIPYTPSGYLFMYSRVAYPRGADAFAFNPSLVGEKEIGFSASNYVVGVKMGILSASIDRKWGVSLLYLTSGSMEHMDENGQVLGSFSTNHIALSATRKKNLKENIDIGVSGKILYQNILDYSSLALAFDVGGVYRHSRIKGLTLGAVLRNVGVEIKPFIEERSLPPLELLLGATFETPSIVLGAGVASSLDQLFAMSLTFIWSVSKYLKVGFGYTTGRRDLDTGSGRDILNGLSAGFDISIRGIQVSYSFTPFGELGDIHTIGVQYNLKH